MRAETVQRRLLVSSLAFGLSLLALPFRAARAAGAPSAAAGHHDGSDAHAGHAMPTSAGAVTERVPVRVPPLALRDQHGRAVALDDMLAASAPLYVNFIFTSCTTVCPVMTAVFAELQHLAARQSRPIRLISVSIDPLTDTPARLEAYARRHGAGPAWTFLTGTAQASVDAQKAFGVYRGDKMNHPVAAFHRAPGHESWTRVDGFANPEQLLRLAR